MKKFFYLFAAFLMIAGLSGCGKIKVVVPQVHLTFGDPVELSFELKEEVGVGGRFPIPDLEGAFLEIVPNNPATKAPAQIVLSVPRSQFENEKFKLRDPQALPDGRPLPRVSGPLPAVAIQVPEWNNITFYLGPQVAAIFTPSAAKFDPDQEITVGISDNSNRQVGFVTRIPVDKNKQNGGFFVQFFWNQTGEVSATIHESDLQHGYVNAPEYGYDGSSPVDLRDIFELAQ